MLTAFVLMQGDPQSIAGLATEIADIDGVHQVYSVTGDWDLVAIVRVRENDELAEVVTKRLATLDGIRETTTLVAFQSYSRKDLEGMWGLGLD